MPSPGTLTPFDGIHMNNTKTILALTIGAISGTAWAADTAKKSGRHHCGSGDNQ